MLKCTLYFIVNHTTPPKSNNQITLYTSQYTKVIGYKISTCIVIKKWFSIVVAILELTNREGGAQHEYGNMALEKVELQGGL